MQDVTASTDAGLGAIPGLGTVGQATAGLADAVQIVLWLLACAAGMPDTALTGLGLSQAELERLRRVHATELEGLTLLHRAAALLGRKETGKLLRLRLNIMALSCTKPSELAAIARTVKTLPEWVWDDAVDGDGERHKAQGSGPMTGEGARRKAQGASEGAMPVMPPLPGGPALNRHQRRALEAQLRKG